MPKYHVKIGIIGGSGLNNPNILKDGTERIVDTPYGPPSDVIIEGKISGVECALLARHGRRHTISPTNVNYRANIWALKSLGCTHILASTATGSLREEIQPGDFVILDQFIDRTTKRDTTFFDGSSLSPGGVCHIPIEPPFCPRMRKILLDACTEMNIKVHSEGTAVCIEGPRFSSKAESLLFKLWGAHLVNMTLVPEVVLAKEAGMCYGSVAMATDYDCWKESIVCVDEVMKTFHRNAEKMTSLFLKVIPVIGQEVWDDTLEQLKSCVESSTMIPQEAKP